MEIGRMISKLRTEKELNQRELASLLGVSNGAIGMWETGKRQPDLETIKKIATLFKVPTDYLLGVGVFENWDVLLKNKTIIMHQISKQAQQLSMNIKDGVDDLSFAKLVYAFDVRIKMHEDGTIGLSATDPIPTYTNNYFSNTPSISDAEKKLLSLYRVAASEEKNEILDLLNSFCSLNKKNRTKVLGKCYELEDSQSSVAADEELKKTGTDNPKK